MHTWLNMAAQTPPPPTPTGEFNLDWMAVGVFISICVGNALLLGNISKLLGPNRPTASKLTPYESGMPLSGRRSNATQCAITSWRCSSSCSTSKRSSSTPGR